MGVVLAMLLAAAAAAPHPVVEAARGEGLPVALLEAKAREAALKGVDAARLDVLLHTLHDHLRTAAAALPSGPGAPSARAQLVSSAALALASGAEPSSLGTLLRASSEPATQMRSFQALTALLSARVPPARAARIVARAVEGGLADRLLSVRPALEALRGSGYGEEDVLDRLEAAVGSGRAPLDAVRAEERGSGGDGRTSATLAVRSPDRDRSDRDEKKAKKEDRGRGEKP